MGSDTIKMANCSQKTNKLRMGLINDYIAFKRLLIKNLKCS